MSDAYDRVDLGTDSSGRPLVMNKRMQAMLEETIRRCGVEPTVVQGAYRGAAAADASAGTHDAGGCLDLRTWDITTDERDRLMRVARQVGWAAWHRTTAQGFEDHMHWVALGDAEMHPDARDQEQQYRSGLNGLASAARDDFWRPDPIPTFDYDTYIQEDSDMQLTDKLFPKRDDSPTVREALVAAIRGQAGLTDLQEAEQARGRAMAKRQKEILAALNEVEESSPEAATKAQVKKIRLQVEDAIEQAEADLSRELARLSKATD